MLRPPLPLTLPPAPEISEVRTRTVAPPDSAVRRLPTLSPGQERVTREHLVEGLSALGLAEGMLVVVHASLRAFAPISGGAPTLLAALLDVLGPDGLLVVPTFNHGVPFASGGAGIYDPKETTSLSGALSRAVLDVPHVVRSLHPTHPFAALGHGAEELLEARPDDVTFGRRSPLYRLEERGGFLLHLGTDHASSTAKHMVEVLRRSPCIDELGDQFPVRRVDGRIELRHSFRFRESACPITDDAALLDAVLTKAKVERRRDVCGAPCRLVRLRDFHRVVGELLDRGYEHRSPCEDCKIRPSTRREGEW